MEDLTGSGRRLVRGFAHPAVVFAFFAAHGCAGEPVVSTVPHAGGVDGVDVPEAGGAGGRDVPQAASSGRGGATGAGTAEAAGGSSGAAGAGPSELDEKALRGLLGQYDLEFGDPYSFRSDDGFGPDECGGDSWLGARARLDLVEVDGAFSAVVSPEWGRPAAYDVVGLADGVLRLAWVGEVPLEDHFEYHACIADDVAGPAKREWNLDYYSGSFGESDLAELRIRVESGALEEAAEADFLCLCVSGWDLWDWVWYSAKLAVRADETGPRLRVVGEEYPPDSKVFQCDRDAGTTPGLAAPPEDSLFPWDPVVESSEPASESTVLEALSVAAAGAPADDVTSLSVQRLSGKPMVAFDDWDAVRGTTQMLTQLQPLVDASGNSGDQLKQSVEVLDVGPALVRHDFDSAGSVAVWGNAYLDTEGAQCEQGGCAVLESTGLLRDPAPRTGIAGRLKVAGAERMRVRLSSNYAWGPEGRTPLVIALYYPGLRVERHVPEARPTISIGAGGASGAGSTAREWIWEEIDLDATQPEVGFRIYLQGNLSAHFTDPAPEDEVIIIDEVLVE